MTDTDLLQSLSDMIDSKLKSITDNMASKDDLKAFATKDDINETITSAKDELYNEIVRAEKQIDKIDSHVDTLSNKIDTLLLKADNTTLLLKLINQQSDELTALKARLEVVEQKLA